MKRTLVEALGIVLAAAALALAVNGLRPGGIDLLPAAPRSAPTAPGGPGPAAVAEIGIDAVARMHAAGEVLLADARGPEAYAAGHITGARNLPALRPDSWLESVFMEVDPDRFIVTYCDGESCELARELADTLTAAGFTRVRYMVDGWGRWQQRGLPVGP